MRSIAGNLQPLGCGEFAKSIAGEFARFTSRRMKELWLSKPRRICEEITRGEFKGCGFPSHGEFATLCEARVAGNWTLKTGFTAGWDFRQFSSEHGS